LSLGPILTLWEDILPQEIEKVGNFIMAAQEIAGILRLVNLRVRNLS
jgi:hypothetical protein